jgi:serine/threonine-protein kinase
VIGTTLGHYGIVEKIGAGGMGVVYRAHDERLDRDVAIKVLREEVAADPDRLRRFEVEARVVARLDHPNILAIHDLGTDQGVAYAVMELLKGVSLREVISRVGLTTEKALEYAKSIADGLAAAHDSGVIHRDLKPENVFLTRDGRIKILDFGLAKLRLPEANLTTETPTQTLDTAPGSLIGTVAYMAPEQVQGQPADHRSDVFALGVMLYEMLTGHRPFGGSTSVETAAAILKEDPEPISVVAPAVPPALAKVVSKCLEKRPEDRFSSAHDLALTLGAFDTAGSGPPAEGRSVISKRWPHFLAVAIAAVIGLLVILPPEALFERGGDEPADAPLPRIVVLPFENLGSPEDEYFADGMTEEIISRLAAVSGLQVISRTSSMYYKGRQLPLKQIGEELNVGFVLEGTIRWDRSGEDHGRVRITPQLIKVADDSHLWSERYDRVLEDIFTVQSDIARHVVTHLQTTLLEPERRAIETRPTDNMEAYHSYLVGVQYWWTSDEEEYMRLAIEMLERAVELDPEFAVAHAMLSEVHSGLYHWRYDFTTERLDRAKASAERALQLKPGLPEGHRALGWYYYRGFRDYYRALDELAIAAEKLPNDAGIQRAFSAIAKRQGQWDDALEAHEAWRQVDPQSYFAATNAAVIYIHLRAFERCEEEVRRAIAIAPDRPDAYYIGANNYLRWDGSTHRAWRLLESAPRPDSLRIADMSVQLDLYDRKPGSALARLNDQAIYTSVSQIESAHRELRRCFCLSEIDEEREAEAACRSAIVELDRELEARRHDHRLHRALGQAYAVLGQREDAMRAGESAVELMPISKDAEEGSFQSIELAKIYARVGEADKALDLIEELLSIPCWLSVGLLRLDPVWDPLRDHPRFQALLEEYDERSNVETLER